MTKRRNDNLYILAVLIGYCREQGEIPSEQVHPFIRLFSTILKRDEMKWQSEKSY